MSNSLGDKDDPGSMASDEKRSRRRRSNVLYGLVVSTLAYTQFVGCWHSTWKHPQDDRLNELVIAYRSVEMWWHKDQALDLGQQQTEPNKINDIGKLVAEQSRERKAAKPQAISKMGAILRQPPVGQLDTDGALVAFAMLAFTPGAPAPLVDLSVQITSDLMDLKNRIDTEYSQDERQQLQEASVVFAIEMMDVYNCQIDQAKAIAVGQKVRMKRSERNKTIDKDKFPKMVAISQMFDESLKLIDDQTMEFDPSVDLVRQAATTSYEETTSKRNAFIAGCEAVYKKLFDREIMVPDHWLDP